MCTVHSFCNIGILNVIFITLKDAFKKKNFFNKICFKYPYANPLSVPKESEKFILNQTT